MKIFVYPYKMGSRSARLLSSSLQAKQVYPDRNYRHKQNHLVINWGNSTIPGWYAGSQRILNDPHCVSISSNKLKTFRAFEQHGILCPVWTEDKSTAQEWEEEGSVVFSRTILNGHSGRGIVQGVVAAPLYTKYFKRKNEYRVHVFRNNIVDVQQKKRREGAESNTFIRNHRNGWVFCRDGVEAPIKVLEESIKAVNSLGLDFGAVDVGYNEHYDKVCIFEVNTAPGLEGTTLERYCGIFKNHSESL